MSADNVSSTWPEQEAVEDWWRKHQHELKEAVTEERLKLQDKIREKEREVDLLIKTFRHTHEAHYEDGKLTEECDDCGLSIRHDIHFRVGEK